MSDMNHDAAEIHSAVRSLQLKEKAYEGSN
jgi:hypothetical protein